MRRILLISFIITAVTSFAQKEVLDTVYYDKDWKGCSPTFASFYRVMTVPTEANPAKQLRDYFITGELQGESKYISVDKNDDRKTIFDGDVTSYYRNGKIHQQSKWVNSHRIGDALEYYENGNVRSHYSHNDKGNIDGEYSFFDEDGNISSMVEFHDGIPSTYFTAYNKMGAMGHYDLNTQRLVTEAVPVSSMKTKIVKGDKFYYYDDKNGIYLSIFVDAVKHYGKYYRIGISMFNNTNAPIVFDPSKITAHGRFFKKSKIKNQEESDDIDASAIEYYYDPSTVKTKDIRVWTFADYSKKVHRRQMWDEALVAIGQGMSTWGAGQTTVNSTSTTYGSAYGYGSGNAYAYGSGGYAYGSYNSNAYVSGSATTHTTTTYYDATAAAIAQERAANNIATYSASLEADTQAINENYLQLTTLEPQTELGGYILLNKDKPQIIDLIIPVNGVAYQFHLTEIPK